MTIIGCVPAKKYRIKLSQAERKELEAIVDRGTHSSIKYKRAMALLLSDESDSGPARSDREIEEVTRMRQRTVERLRKRCHIVGPLEALERVPRARPPVESKITGEIEAKLVQIACSEAPDGVSKWTLSLIAEEAVRLEIINSISRASVGNVLKKRLKTVEV